MGIPQKSGDFWAYIIFHRITQEMLTTDIFHLQELITVILNFLKILNFYLQIFLKIFSEKSSFQAGITESTVYLLYFYLILAWLELDSNRNSPLEVLCEKAALKNQQNWQERPDLESLFSKIVKKAWEGDFFMKNKTLPQML